MGNKTNCEIKKEANDRADGKMNEKTNVREGSVTIRIASQADAAALLEIYAPYVTGTAITFEYEVPSPEEFAGRIRHTLERYPYLVAEADGQILGYAYVSPFKERAAYDWAVETSIYVRQDFGGRGIGRRLYEGMEQILVRQNILNLNACIACPETDDEYLTHGSIRFHEKMGYRMVGMFHNCGYKFDRWYHMVWMEKMIGPHTAPQLPVIPFPVLCDSVSMRLDFL